MTWLLCTSAAMFAYFQLISKHTHTPTIHCFICYSPFISKSLLQQHVPQKERPIDRSLTLTESILAESKKVYRNGNSTCCTSRWVLTQLDQVGNYCLKHLWPAFDGRRGGAKPAALERSHSRPGCPNATHTAGPISVTNPLPPLTFWEHIQTATNHGTHLKTCPFAAVTTCGSDASAQLRSSRPSPHSRAGEQIQRRQSHFSHKQLINKTF